MKYSEATKLIKGLSKKYSIYNNDKYYFEIIYKSKSIAWVDKQQQLSFGHVNTLASEFDKLPYSYKLWMILAELAMTPLDKRKDEHKWNVIVGNDNSGVGNVVCWEKSDSEFPYILCFSNQIYLSCDDGTFTDEEFSDLIKHIKTLPNGEWQARVAEHGKTEVKE
ncbi:hypothetical protein [Lentilactobacillus kefiri]|uniref:hypothetical protein n=1 Tax=Lentilactobacillus kefiri TaxID=33962 RepID=UPI00345ED284